ncbi:lysophospholipid acyltransferase family protein [uncultured Oxalicibacterium sp.]|uniref:lysophospholipid acyltransferase family protein n=1 Tax=uncultured Oxalicibacterium sp. TaxID=1168540 RepID=UPI0025E7DCB2|nr:lysophospholipid acyltransferase family protein [uncultured Oxalicibacterium sp.]
MKHLIKGLRQVRNVVILFLSLLGLTLMMLFGSPWLALRSQFMKPEDRQAYVRRAITVGYRRYFTSLHYLGVFELDLTDIDRLQGEPGLILTSNHPSLFDALLIISRLPNVVCIMKAQVLRNPMFGHGAGMAGYIPNDSIRTIVSDAERELKEVGSQLLLFPEGTRSLRKRLNPFQGTVGLIARKTGCPVQTIFIESDSGFLGKGWPFWKAPAFPVRIRVRAGKRFTQVEDSKLFIAELKDYYEQELGTRRAPVAQETAEEIDVVTDDPTVKQP